MALIDLGLNFDELMKEQGNVIELLETAKRKFHPIHFGRWLLKHCTPVFEGDLLTWSYKGKNIDTMELYYIFLDDQPIK